ncbi:fibronectin type III domain-containing protein [Paenibacillus sp. P25]|nr:fibronectin type III domain-containing protein [Paenibacillus sp. P25]
MYKSVNRGTFQRVNGKVVMAGDETKFTDNASGNAVYGYYVTAVDVAGKESTPSKAAYTDGSTMDLLPLTISPDKERPQGDAGNGTKEGSGQGTGQGAGDTKTPPAKEAPSVPSGLSIKSSGSGIELDWKANPDKDAVKQYSVYHSDKENGTYKKIGTVSGATKFKYYAVSYDGYYRITAENNIGESKPTAPVRFKK